MALSVDRINGLTGDLAIKTPVRVATTANITLSGLQTIDGVTLVAEDRVLVKNQTSAADNGIWVANTSAWSRALDFDGRFDVVQGTFVSVVSGTVNGGSAFKLDTASPVIGTSSLTFSVANDFALRADLASTASGKGASLVGINDVGGLITATTVEAALQEAFTAINTKLSKLSINTLTQDGTQHVEIQKDGTPLNYGSTKAAWVLQHRDTAAGSTNELIPGAVWQFRSSGNGTVTAGSELSQTIWQGLYSFMEKTGDGSAHSFTSVGELGAYGVGGYNELGLFQGEGTNKGSALGTISGVEMLLKDSPDSGATSYSTKMQGVVSRLAKYNATVRKSYNFFASSEGTQGINGIIGVNTGGLKTWDRGFDFEGAIFSTGQFGLAPNNTFLGWLNAGGSAKSILGLNSSDNTFLAFSSASNKGVLSDHSFNSVLEWDDNANDGVLILVGGSVKRIGQGGVDSGGAGFRQLIVAN